MPSKKQVTPVKGKIITPPGAKVKKQTETLAYLMPVYNLISWYLIITNNQIWSIAVPLFGAVWALKNILQYKKFDAGVISMGLHFILSVLQRYVYSDANTILEYAQLFACLLVAANFAIIPIMWKKFTMVFDKVNKSSRWRAIFYSYCSSFTVFWLYAAYLNIVTNKALCSMLNIK